MSASIALVQIAMALKPGYAYGGIERELIGRAAVDDLPMLDRMGGYRQSDIDEFVQKISANFGVRLWENERGTWTMQRHSQTAVGSGGGLNGL